MRHPTPPMLSHAGAQAAAPTKYGSSASWNTT